MPEETVTRDFQEVDRGQLSREERLAHSPLPFLLSLRLPKVTTSGVLLELASRQQQVKQPCQPPPVQCQETCAPQTKEPCAPQAKKQCPPKGTAIPAQQKCPPAQQASKSQQK
ncbi:small proline-rich protein 4 [Pteropus alecto]|uniref:small proline-rich protein 4 n=1 Tax=Pteropus alecto TaxID=9402 RepID=UPI00076880E0|nr:small proline-rich protein 4 [Pteropus alecto]